MKRAALLLVLVIAACAGDETVDTPTKQLRDCRVPIFYQATTPLQTPPRVIFDAGPTFELEDAGKGLWRTLLQDLPPGRHAYLLEVEGERKLDALHPWSWYPRSGDDERSMLVVPDCSRGTFEVTERRGSSDALDISLKYLRAHNKAPLASVEATHSGGVPVEDVSFHPETGDIHLSLRDLPFGKYEIHVTGKDTKSQKAESIHVTQWTQSEPFDWRDAIIYQIMVDRFRSSHGPLQSDAGISHIHGGNLEGITDMLERGYFEDLGIQVLWLSPVYTNPSGVFTGRDGHLAQGYHGYWPIKPREVDPRLGGAQALERLVGAAHERGVRVMLDIVLNHVHQEHPYAQAAEREQWFNQPDGGCICGITCAWGAFMETCWFDPFMPDLQLRNPRVMDTMVEDALWWVERFGLDGLRLDAVPMMPRTVLRELRRRVRARFEQGGHHVYLLGETYSQRGEQPLLRYYLGPDTLSGQFDFPVMWALRDVLARRAPMRVLAQEAEKSDRAWEGSGAIMAPILGNHDVPRFLSDVNGDVVWSPRTTQPGRPESRVAYDLLRMAWTFLMAQPGAPVIYYGDEYGMPGANDPDNRRDMPQEGDVTPWEASVRERLVALTHARACSHALRRGKRHTLMARGDVYAHARDAGDGKPAFVVLNRGDTPALLEIPIPQQVEISQNATFATLSGLPVMYANRTLRLEVPARTGVLILAESECVR